MKIAIHLRVLNERRGGPARYTLNLLKELAKLDKTNKYYLLFYGPFSFGFQLPDNFEVKIFRIKSRILFDYFYLPIFSYFNKIDLFLFPKNTFSPFVKGKKIPVYHDIIYFEDFKFREFKFFDNLHHKIMISVCSKFSTADLTVSDFTASRMKELLNIDEKKIKIIKEGVENDFRVISDQKYLLNILKKFNINKPYFFYAGSLSPRKNIINVINAFNKIKDDIQQNIYFTGGDSWKDNQVYQLISKYKLQDRIIKLGFVSEDELIALYNKADAYLYPSLYEGFGLPILEAQACGCPVITSNVASCPEVAGEGALLVDPYNIDDIASSMLKIVSDEKFKNKLIKKGFENCKAYSWEKAAGELIEFFKDCYNGSYNGDVK